VTPTTHHSAARPALRPSWSARIRASIARALGRSRAELSVTAVLDLFEEHFYVGEITAEGRYVSLASSPTIARIFGGPLPPGAEPGALWESMVQGGDGAG
jgi:hypothetical protein